MAVTSENVPRCATCGGACQAAEDAWVCTRCGDEWYPDHGPEYRYDDAPHGEHDEYRWDRT